MPGVPSGGPRLGPSPLSHEYKYTDFKSQFDKVLADVAKIKVKLEEEDEDIKAMNDFQAGLELINNFINDDSDDDLVPGTTKWWIKVKNSIRASFEEVNGIIMGINRGRDDQVSPRTYYMIITLKEDIGLIFHEILDYHLQMIDPTGTETAARITNLLKI